MAEAKKGEKKKEKPVEWKPKTFAITKYITDQEDLLDTAKKLCKSSTLDQIYEIYDPGVDQEIIIKCGPPLAIKTNTIKKPASHLNNRFRILKTDFLGAALYAMFFSSLLMTFYFATIWVINQRRK